MVLNFVVGDGLGCPAMAVQIGADDKGAMPMLDLSGALL